MRESGTYVLGSAIPCRPAQAAIPAREGTASLRMLLPGLHTVRSLMKSASAISRLARPAAMWAATSRSRGVSPQAGCPPDRGSSRRRRGSDRPRAGLRRAAPLPAKVPPGARRPPRLPPLRGVLRRVLLAQDLRQGQMQLPQRWERALRASGDLRLAQQCFGLRPFAQGREGHRLELREIRNLSLGRKVDRRGVKLIDDGECVSCLAARRASCAWAPRSRSPCARCFEVNASASTDAAAALFPRLTNADARPAAAKLIQPREWISRDSVAMTRSGWSRSSSGSPIVPKSRAKPHRACTTHCR